MTPLRAFLKFKGLLVVNTLAAMAVAVRLYTLGLHKRYRWFFLYWVVGVGRSLLLMPFPTNRSAYLYLWLSTQPLIWLVNVAVVQETYSLVLREHRGIYSLGRWFYYGAVSVAVILSLLALVPTWGTPTRLHHVFFLVDRGVRTSLAVFLLLLLAFIHWFPVPMCRNLLLHCFVYSAYYLSGSMALLVRTLFGADLNYLVSTILTGVGLAAQLTWIIFLSRQGETVPARVPLRRGAEVERRLLEQLDSINTALLRAGRK